MKTEILQMKETFDEIIAHISDFLVKSGLRLVLAIVVLLVGLKLAKVITNKIINSKSVKKIDPSVYAFLDNFILLMLNVIVIVSAALILGIPATAFIALLGTAGVAMGLALQGAFSNFAGGIMLLIFRPFKVGDFISSEGFSGTVNDISIFYTVLQTVDNNHITIPNGTLMNSSITNYSAEDRRRADLVFTVAYSSDIDKVKEILLRVADEHPLALKDPAPFARLTAHSQSSLDFTLRVWAESADFWTVKLDLLENVKKEFDKNGIEIPFPQLDVHLDK